MPGVPETPESPGSPESVEASVDVSSGVFRLRGWGVAGRRGRGRVAPPSSPMRPDLLEAPGGEPRAGNGRRAGPGKRAARPGCRAWPGRAALGGRRPRTRRRPSGAPSRPSRRMGRTRCTTKDLRLEPVPLALAHHEPAPFRRPGHGAQEEAEHLGIEDLAPVVEDPALGVDPVAVLAHGPLILVLPGPRRAIAGRAPGRHGYGAPTFRSRYRSSGAMTPIRSTATQGRRSARASRCRRGRRRVSARARGPSSLLARSGVRGHGHVRNASAGAPGAPGTGAREASRETRPAGPGTPRDRAGCPGIPPAVR